MKKEEIDILGLKKSKEGKSYKQIKKEIIAIDNSCKNIKLDKKLIGKLMKEVEKLKEKIEKQSKKIFDLKLENSYNKVTKDELTLFEMKEIINTIKLNPDINLTMIKEKTEMKREKIVSALMFLKRNNIIAEVSCAGVKRYRG